MTLFDLSGKTALVTGSSQGIGFALARGLAEAGASVVLNGRDTAKLNAAVSPLAGEGHSVTTVRGTPAQRKAHVVWQSIR